MIASSWSLLLSSLLLTASCHQAGESEFFEVRSRGQFSRVHHGVLAAEAHVQETDKRLVRSAADSLKVLSNVVKVKSREDDGPLTSREQRELALKDTVNALTAAGVQFVLAYGSALGMARDGRLIDPDDDIDFIVDDDTYHLALPAILKMNQNSTSRSEGGHFWLPGFQSWEYFQRVQGPAWGPVEFYRTTTVDPNQVQNASDNSFFCMMTDEILLPKDQLFPAKFVEYRAVPGLSVPVPNRLIEHVENLYGPDWRTPLAKGHYGRDYYNDRAHKLYSRLCNGDKTLPEDWLSMGLMIPLSCIAYLAWKSPKLNWTAFFGHGSYEVGLVGMFMVFSAISTLCLRQTDGSAVQMTIGAVFVLYAFKAMLSFGLVLFKQSMSFGEVVEGLRQMQVRALCQLALIGSLFACGDALSFLAMQHLPPVSFQLILLARCFILAPLQYCLLGKKVTLLQFYALLFIVIGACGLAGGDINSLNSAHDFKSRNAYTFGIVMLFGQVLVSALALVVNERVSHQSPLTVYVQNLIIHSCGICFLIVGRMTWVIVTSYPLTFGEDAVLVLQYIPANPWLFASVLFMAAVGLICAHLLKANSAMENEFVSLGVVALVAVGQVMTPGEYNFKAHSWVSALIITLASFTCCVNMIRTPPPPVKSQSTPVQE